MMIPKKSKRKVHFYGFRFAVACLEKQMARTWTACVNIDFSKNLKFAVDYEQTHFRGRSIIRDRKTEKLVLSRLQIISEFTKRG